MPPRPRAPRHVLDVPQLCWLIDQKRTKHDMSERQVALAVGVVPSTLARLRDGHAPHSDTLIALLAWLGVSDVSKLTRHRAWLVGEDARRYQPITEETPR